MKKARRENRRAFFLFVAGQGEPAGMGSKQKREQQIARPYKSPFSS